MSDFHQSHHPLLVTMYNAYFENQESVFFDKKNTTLCNQIPARLFSGCQFVDMYGSVDSFLFWEFVLERPQQTR